MKNLLIYATTAIATFGPLSAQDENFKPLLLSSDLGSLLASEEYCGLNYNQDAIDDFIQENVDPNDLSFPTHLNTAIIGHKYTIEQQTASMKTAHCSAISSSANHYGFLNQN